METLAFAKKLQSATFPTGTNLRIGQITNTTQDIGDTFVTMADGVEVPARYLGSYKPELGDMVQVFISGNDVLVLGSVKKASEFGGGEGSIPDGTYVTFDAEGDADAPRPTEPEGAYFIWINVPSKPTNLGPFDLWEDPERDFELFPIQENELGDGVVTNPKVAQNAIDVENIIDGAVARVKIAEAAINEALIENGAVSETKIADDSITTPKIVSNAIIGDHIQARQVDAFHVVAGSITAFEIATRTITAEKIKAEELTATEIAAGTITGDRIAGQTITGDRIAAGTISADNITSGSLTSASGVFGTISADDITTGTLNASLVTIDNLTVNMADVTGNLSANRISGGTISATITMTSPIIDISNGTLVIDNNGLRLVSGPGNINSIRWVSSGGAYRSSIWTGGSSLHIDTAVGNISIERPTSISGTLNVSGALTAQGTVRSGGSFSSNIVLTQGTHSHTTSGLLTTSNHNHSTSICMQSGSNPSYNIVNANEFRTSGTISRMYRPATNQTAIQNNSSTSTSRCFVRTGSVREQAADTWCGSVDFSGGNFRQHRASTHANQSDIRQKEDIKYKDEKGWLDQIKQVPVFEFTFKGEAELHQQTDGLPAQKHLGVAAQDLPEILVEKTMLGDDPETAEEVLMVSTSDMDAFLLAAIKELTTKVEELEGKLNA